MNILSTDKQTGEIINKKIRNWLNYEYQEDSIPEINNEPSMTIPDETMSVSEIVRRYAQGQPISGNSGEEMFYEEELPDPKKKWILQRSKPTSKITVGS